MCDTRTYLPCCRDYNGCRQHYPPGIYASQGDVKTKYSAEAPKLRSKVRNLLSSATKSITRRRTPISKTSILSLPVELLQQIASCLSLASRAAFAFSNKEICHAIGQDSWVLLKTAENKEDKIEFLCLIRDSWFCQNCDELHPHVFDLSPYYRNYDGFDYPFGYRLPSRLVQLAIERNQKGPPHGICPDRLSCAGIFIKPGMRFEYAYRVCVNSGALILRFDVRIMPSRHEPPPPCMHSPFPPIVMDQKLRSQSGPIRHYKADYPYVPRCPEGVTDPDPQLLKEFFPDTTHDFRSTWACGLCTCFTQEVPVLASNYNPHEKLARSFQNVGSGAKDDDIWRQTITPASRFSRPSG